MSAMERDIPLDTGLLTSMIDNVGFLDRDLIAHASRIVPLVMVTLDRLPDVTPSDRSLARATALLHDAGKVGLPAKILLKPSALTPGEMAIVRRHAAIGANFLAQVFNNDLLAAAVRHHHEWWNGQGYPCGLAGMHIPLVSRVVGIADAFDAMTTDRPYRSARDISSTIEELKRCSGTQFDPDIVQAFTEAITDHRLPTIHRSTA